MNDFDFRLEKVLELRTDREREMASKLADAMRRVDEVHERKRHLAARREAARDRMSELQGAGDGDGGGSAGDMQSLSIVVERIEDRLREVERELVVAREEMNARMEDFEEALQERQVIERLRKRRLKEWREEKVRAERKRMDEIAINRHGSDSTISSGPREERP